MSAFYHEKLEIYKRSLDMAIQCDRVARILPAYRQDLKVQLWRASTSAPFNVAEATAGHTTATRIHHFRIARGSTAECSAIFDYIAGINLLGPEQMPYDAVREVAAMLGTSVYKYRR